MREDCSDFKYFARVARNKYILADEVLVSPADKKQVLDEGYAAIQRAFLCPGAEDSADCHKWFALLSTEVGSLNGPKARIDSIPLFQQHGLRALEIDPLDPDLHHMMGRFCYELSNIGWATKRLVNLTLGQMPDVTLDEALNYFLRAQQLKPNWIRNDLWLVKALRDSKRLSEARTLLAQLVKLSPESRSDREALEEAKCFSF